MAQAVEDVVETKVVGKRVRDGVYHLRNGAGFKLSGGGRRFKALHYEAWHMDPRSYRELAAELTAVADAMEFGKVGEERPVPAERSESPLVFTVRSEGWPRLGLYSSGALAFFHDNAEKLSRTSTVIVKRGTRYKVGYANDWGIGHNPLPEDGVLIHQQEGDSFPKLGLSNSGELCLFEGAGSRDNGSGYVVAPEGRMFPVGYKFRDWDYNPLPVGGVLLKPEA
jgi:hypothetical protein